MNHYIKRNLNKDKKVKIFLIILIIFQLFYIAEKKVNFEFKILVNAFKPNFGSKYILEEDILELKSITNKEKLTFFNISKNLKKDEYFFQRSVEFLYPIRINPSFNEVFFSTKEEIPESCNIKKKYVNFILVQC